MYIIIKNFEVLKKTKIINTMKLRNFGLFLLWM